MPEKSCLSMPRSGRSIELSAADVARLDRYLNKF